MKRAKLRVIKGGKARAARMGLGSGAPRSPSRMGKRIVSIYVEPDVWYELRLLGLKMNASVQILGEEALEAYLGRYRGAVAAKRPANAKTPPTRPVKALADAMREAIEADEKRVAGARRR